MASFWGEILPVSSRAVDDDDDDNDDDIVTPPKCTLSWSPQLEGKTRCDRLVMAVGDAAVAFVDAALLWNGDAELIGVINAGFAQPNPDEFPPRNLPPTSSTLHRLLDVDKQDSTLVLRLSSPLHPAQFATYLRLLFDRLSFPDQGTADSPGVVLLSGANAGAYLAPGGRRRDEDAESACFLRTLTTTAARSRVKSSGVPFLEAPNLVSGILAQTLTQCEVMGIGAAAYLAFARPPVDQTAVQAFTPLLKINKQAMGLSGIVAGNPKLKSHIAESILRKESKEASLYT